MTIESQVVVLPWWAMLVGIVGIGIVLAAIVCAALQWRRVKNKPSPGKLGVSNHDRIAAAVAERLGIPEEPEDD